MRRMRRLRPLVALVVLALAGVPAAGAPDGRPVPADLRVSVDAAVVRAAAWLESVAPADGIFRWSVPSQRDWSHWGATACDQGLTALASLALVRAGVPRQRPAVARALDALRGALSSAESPGGGADARTFTYGAGSLLWMLSELRPPGFDTAAAQAALALSGAEDADGGWGYHLPRVRLKDGYAEVLRDGVPRAPADLSNAQFALLGLLSADRMGVWRGDVAWARARDGVKRTVLWDGSFGYRHDAEAPDLFRRGRRVTTEIAAANLFVTLRRTGSSRDAALADPTLRRALGWLSGHSFADAATGRWAARDVGDQTDRLPYYEMIAVERLGAFTGLERLGGADWYRVGATTLLALQRADGSWPGGVAEAAFQNAVQHTVLAILFLTRALDAVPVVSPDFTTGDLLAGKDLAGALFDDLVAKGAIGHAGATGESRTAWQRAFVLVGERALAALVRLHAEGPASAVEAVHGLLVALTGAKPEATGREGRTLAWTRWLVEHRGRLARSAAGDAFVEVR